MAMPPIVWRPDRKLLNEFAEGWMFAFGMVGAFSALMKGNTRAAIVLWIVAVAGRAVGLLRPQWLRPLFVGLTLATWPIGWVVSNLILIVVYFGLFTPIAAIFKLSGRDAMKRRFDPSAETYWETYPADASKERYLRPF